MTDKISLLKSAVLQLEYWKNNVFVETFNKVIVISKNKLGKYEYTPKNYNFSNLIKNPDDIIGILIVDYEKDEDIRIY